MYYHLVISFYMVVIYMHTVLWVIYFLQKWNTNMSWHCVNIIVFVTRLYPFQLVTPWHMKHPWPIAPCIWEVDTNVAWQ